MHQQHMPNWAKALLVGAASFMAGLLVAAWFTMSERSALDENVAVLKAGLSETRQQLTETDESRTESYAEVAANNQAIDGLRAELQRTSERLAATEAALATTRAALAAAREAPEQAGTAGSPTAVYDGRCTAITKKGTRCKRSARSNGRCWQHGG